MVTNITCWRYMMSVTDRVRIIIAKMSTTFYFCQQHLKILINITIAQGPWMIVLQWLWPCCDISDIWFSSRSLLLPKNLGWFRVNIPKNYNCSFLVVFSFAMIQFNGTWVRDTEQNWVMGTLHYLESWSELNFEYT